MSLINIRNFAAPLIDKRNLVTIVLIAALFGAIRVSGGHFSTRSATSTPSRSHSETLPASRRTTTPQNMHGSLDLPSMTEEPDFKTEVGRLGMPGSGPAKNPSTGSAIGGTGHRTILDAANEDPFADIRTTEVAPVAPVKKQVPRPTAGKLSDIEKELGLR